MSNLLWLFTCENLSLQICSHVWCSKLGWAESAQCYPETTPTLVAIIIIYYVITRLIIWYTDNVTNIHELFTVMPPKVRTLHFCLCSSSITITDMLLLYTMTCKCLWRNLVCIWQSNMFRTMVAAFICSRATFWFLFQLHSSFRCWDTLWRAPRYRINDIHSF